MAVFLRLLLGFWVLGEEAGVLLAYEFFCGTLTVTCEGRVGRSTYSSHSASANGSPWRQQPLSSLSHLLGGRLSSSEGAHTLSPS